MNKFYNRKTIASMVIGATALFTGIAPVSAGYSNTDQTLWSAVETGCSDDGGNIFRSLVLIGGWANRLDTDGNGTPFYTVFQPLNSVLATFLDETGLEVSELSAQPAVVQALLADHIADGSFSASSFENKNLTRIKMRSGFIATIMGTADLSGGSRVLYDNVYISGSQIVSGGQYGNGWQYCIAGLIDSGEQVPTTGVNTGTATTVPAKESTLPNTL